MQAARGTPLSGDTTATPAPARTPRRLGVLLVIASLTYVLDQLSKALVVDRLSDRGPVEVIRHVLTLHLTRNSGAAFGVGAGSTVVFTGVALVVIVVVLRSARRLRSVLWAVALGLLLGGAFGNLTDRVFRTPGIGRGHVVDFLELPHWPIFNVADMSIVTAASLIVLLTMLGRQLDGTTLSRRPPADAGK